MGNEHAVVTAGTERTGTGTGAGLRIPAPAHPGVQLSLVPRLGKPVARKVLLDELPAITGLAPDRAFVQSVADYGVMEPVILIEHAGGGYVVADGRRRIRAARLALLTRIPAQVYPVGTDAQAVMTLVCNVQRRPNPAAELDAVEQLLDDGLALDDVCKVTGDSKAKIQRLMKLAKLVPELRGALAEGNLAVTVAYAAATLEQFQQLDLAAVLAINGTLTLQDVRERKQAVRDGAVKDLPVGLFADEDMPRERLMAELWQHIQQADPKDVAGLDQLLTQVQGWLNKDGCNHEEWMLGLSMQLAGKLVAWVQWRMSIPRADVGDLIQEQGPVNAGNPVLAKATDPGRLNEQGGNDGQQ